MTTLLTASMKRLAATKPLLAARTSTGFVPGTACRAPTEQMPTRAGRWATKTRPPEGGRYKIETALREFVGGDAVVAGFVLERADFCDDAFALGLETRELVVPIVYFISAVVAHLVDLAAIDDRL
jgi:hypothetical protein